LEELLVSLQWGREQTYSPSTQPHSTAELSVTNHKLAKAVNAHLLGNVGNGSEKKIPSSVEFCSTPAEKMAEKVTYFLFGDLWNFLHDLWDFTLPLLKGDMLKCLVLGVGKCGI
jgi:hypothetical protein